MDFVGDGENGDGENQRGHENKYLRVRDRTDFTSHQKNAKNNVRNRHKKAQHHNRARGEKQGVHERAWRGHLRDKDLAEAEPCLEVILNVHDVRRDGRASIAHPLANVQVRHYAVFVFFKRLGGERVESPENQSPAASSIFLNFSSFVKPAFS